MSSKGGSGGSSGLSNTTGWNTTWDSGSTAAQTELNGANSLYDSGNLLSPYAQPLASDAYNTAATPTGLNNSNQIYSNLADPNSSTNSYLSGIASGSGSSPYLDNAYQQGAGSVQNSLAGEFNSAGRLGSGAQEFNTSQGLNNLANTVYGGAYEDNQNRALTAAQSLQGGQEDAAQGMSSNYNSLLGAYGTASNLATAADPASALSAYSSLINPYVNLNNTTQQNTDNYQNNTGSASKDIGYAVTLASMFA